MTSTSSNTGTVTRGESETIASLTLGRAADFPDRRFLSCAGSERTFGEVGEVALRIGNGLRGLGIEGGSRLAVLAGTRMEFAELYLGCAQAGVVEVPLNAFLKGEFLRYQLEDSEATAIAVDAAGYESLAPILDRLPNLATIILFDDFNGSRVPREIVPYGELVAAGTVASLPAVDASDLAALLYTSGTTGLPKGCMISHGYALRFARHWRRVLELTEDDYLQVLYPLFHASAQIAGLLSPLMAGCAVNLEAAFSAQAFAKQLCEEQYTTVAGVGAHVLLFLAQPASEWERSHSVRAMFFAPCPPAARAELAERFGVEVTASLYGQTECCPVTYDALGSKDSSNTTSCGRAPSDLEIAIVDDDGHPLSAGEAGEIIARPLNRYAVFDGYWRNEEATKRAFRDGWYHTGDVGRLVSDGTLSFIDRKKNVIRRRGENVSSMELENAIAAHPKVEDAAVFPIPSEFIEDEIMAVLELREGEDTTPEELFSYFEANLPYFAIPRYVDIATEIPRNALQKVVKTALQERGVTETTWDFEKLGLVVDKSRRRGSTAG